MHPVLFEIAGHPFGTYGLFALVALAVGVTTFALLAGRAGLSRTLFAELGLWAFVVGLAASKIFGVLVAFDADAPWQSISRVLRFGGHWYVGFLAGVGFLVIAFLRVKVPFPVALDALAPALALAHGIGRLGCFFVGCCWGETCEAPWAVTFTSEVAHAMTGVPLGVPLHPTQLYEGGAELLIGGLLLLKTFRWPWRPGSTFLAYVLLYGAARAAIETVRADPRGDLFGQPVSLPLALGSSVAAAVLLALLASAKRPRRARASAPAAAPRAQSGSGAAEAPAAARAPSGRRRRKRR